MVARGYSLAGLAETGRIQGDYATVATLHEQLHNRRASRGTLEPRPAPAPRKPVCHGPVQGARVCAGLPHDHSNGSPGHAIPHVVV
ncbi:hypothetical protein SBADM41S_10566 [Streptomyces badius]